MRIPFPGVDVASRDGMRLPIEPRLFHKGWAITSNRLGKFLSFTERNARYIAMTNPFRPWDWYVQAGVWWIAASRIGKRNNGNVHDLVVLPKENTESFSDVS